MGTRAVVTQLRCEVYFRADFEITGGPERPECSIAAVGGCSAALITGVTGVKGPRILCRRSKHLMQVTASSQAAATGAAAGCANGAASGAGDTPT